MPSPTPQVCAAATSRRRAKLQFKQSPSPQLALGSVLRWPAALALTAAALACAAAFAAVCAVMALSVGLSCVLSATMAFYAAPYLFVVFVVKDLCRRGVYHIVVIVAAGCK